MEKQFISNVKLKNPSDLSPLESVIAPATPVVFTSQSASATVIKSATLNLRLVVAEAAITNGLLSMPIMTPFFHSIGMSNTQISLSQMLFTAVLMMLNLPLGYLADRLSRKWANIIGDFGKAILFLLYAQVNGFAGVVFCECALGITAALSDGVDFALLKHFTSQLARSAGKNEEKLLLSATAKLEIAKQSVNLVLLALGGPIGAISMRLAIGVSAINQLIGGIISIFIKDDSEKLKPTAKSPLSDMVKIAQNALLNQPLKWRMFAYAIGREMTHSIIWIVTPLFLVVGVPVSVVSLAWVGKTLLTVAGARLAMRFGGNLTDRKKLLVPLVLMSISMLVTGLHLTIFTVWLYGLMGIVQGWTAATMSPMVQRYTCPSEQTSVLSFTKTLAQLLYIPTVWLVGLAADIRLEYGLIITAIIFLPLGLLVVYHLGDQP